MAEVQGQVFSDDSLGYGICDLQLKAIRIRENCALSLVESKYSEISFQQKSHIFQLIHEQEQVKVSSL